MIYFPILLPLVLSILSIFAWNSLRTQRVLAITGSFVLLLINFQVFLQVQQTGILHAQVGNWPAPFGITLVIDRLSAILLLTGSLVIFLAAIFSLSGIDSERARWGYFPLFHFLIVGVNGAFCSGDLFNLYVWFEVMLMASFVLMVLGSERRQLEGGLKYVILNLLSSILFLSAIGLTYHFTGSLNLAQLTINMRVISSQGIALLIAVLFLVGFGIKAAIFPFFFWLPASYHTPPITITALFSGLLTKVGVYALIRVFSLLFASQMEFLQPFLLILAGLTMVIGVLGAAAQTDFRRLLSFHIISQIGYLFLGFALFTKASLAAAIYFMVHVIFAKMALFFVAGLIEKKCGSFDLRRLGGLYRNSPILSIFFLIPALALAGIPPLSGFFAKLLLLLETIRLQKYGITIIALLVSLLTLFSMTKIWNEVFWKPPLEEGIKSPQTNHLTSPISMWIPIITLGLIVVLMGIFADPLINLTNAAAGSLLQPQTYIEAILGAGK